MGRVRGGGFEDDERILRGKWTGERSQGGKTIVRGKEGGRAGGGGVGTDGWARGANDVTRVRGARASEESGKDLDRQPSSLIPRPQSLVLKP